MMIMKLVVKCFDDSIQNVFHDYIENNEICTVQDSSEFLDNGNWSLEIVPQNDEDKKEFMQLCNGLVEYLEEMGYEF